MKIGAHIPTRSDYRKMAAYAQEVGCECIQIFAKSPRMWKQKDMPLAKRDEMLEGREVFDFGPILTHTSYLINLTTTNEELYEKSIVALADELVRGAIIGASGVNTHCGNVPDGEYNDAIDRGGVGIDRAFALADDACSQLGIICATQLILENTAGAGSTFGGPIKDLCVLAQNTQNIDRIGICIDTCHAWAQGYDVSTPEGWREITDELIVYNGLEMWRFVHANDCKFGRGMHKDRHEWIGKGEIGLQGFAELFELSQKFPELDRLCLMTELSGEEPEKDIVNIQVLKALREEAI